MCLTLFLLSRLPVMYSMISSARSALLCSARVFTGVYETQFVGLLITHLSPPVAPCAFVLIFLSVTLALFCQGVRGQPIREIRRCPSIYTSTDESSRLM